MKEVFYKGWRPILVIILFLILWEMSSFVFQIPGWILPAPSDIFRELVVGWSNYRDDLFSTIQLIIIGLTIGSGTGIIAAILLHLYPKLRQAFYPILIISQNIPMIVLAPLLVIWFGFGLLPKIIVITLVCFFPITISLLDGFRQTDRDLVLYMQMVGASKGQIFRKLEWPYALPFLFSGLKISATYSVMGAVISEWLGASKGIGVYMTLASSSFRTDRVFVAIMIIIVLSLCFFLFILFLEKKFIKWKGKEEGTIHEIT
ncbi:ABC transporter permease [Fervidibacillus halotolerans]|uniref:ABC transporter permease n=1 Tax=Fervidibacillus halotolerans TaxID=2980027 RepID=A0A9E8LZU4_9BACI|nr:ABC transporter permease [Fervidibacillus halotolerans]WAA12863.1 ABC transporter permease [Fervidibacillus halotolerans]